MVFLLVVVTFYCFAFSTSLFTLLPLWLQLVHFQSWSSSSANHFSKQFSKLAAPSPSDNGISIQLKASFFTDWYLQLLYSRLMKHSLAILVTVALELYSLLAQNVSSFLLYCVLTSLMPTSALSENCSLRILNDCSLKLVSAIF